MLQVWWIREISATNKAVVLRRFINMYVVPQTAQVAGSDD